MEYFETFTRTARVRQIARWNMWVDGRIVTDSGDTRAGPWKTTYEELTELEDETTRPGNWGESLELCEMWINWRWAKCYGRGSV